MKMPSETRSKSKSNLDRRLTCLIGVKIGLFGGINWRSSRDSCIDASIAKNRVLFASARGDARCIFIATRRATSLPCDFVSSARGRPLPREMIRNFFGELLPQNGVSSRSNDSREQRIPARVAFKRRN